MGKLREVIGQIIAAVGQTTPAFNEPPRPYPTKKKKPGQRPDDSGSQDTQR